MMRDAGDMYMKSGRIGKASLSVWMLLAVLSTPLILSTAYAAKVPVKKSRQEQKNQAIDELMRLSGFDLMFEYYGSQFLQQSIAPKSLPAEQIIMLRNILDRVSEPEDFSRTVSQYMVKNYRSGYVKPLMNWYRSPLGQKVVAGEKQVNDSAYNIDKEQFVERLKFYPPREERLALIEGLEKSMGLTDQSLDVFMTLVKVLIPLNKHLEDRSTRSVVNEIRQELYDSFQEQVLRNLLFAYRDVTDKELEQYRRFVSTGAGRWFVQSSQKGTKFFYGRVVVRVEDLMNQIVEEMETGKGESDLLKEIAPPGQRYLFVTKRDPFVPLVDPKEGLIQYGKEEESRTETRSLADELKNLPPIPLEVFKNIKRTNPRLYADLENYGDLFGRKNKLSTMEDDEFFQTVQRYKNLIQTANESSSSLMSTPTQTDYDALKLVGVIWKNNEILALIETEDKKGHTVKEGDLLGPNFGVVESINKDQIYVLEQSRDYLGNILSRKKEIEFIQVSQEEG